MFEDGAQVCGVFAVGVNVVGQFAAQAALHEVEEFGVVVFDGAGNGVVVRQAGTDDAGNVARDGFATGGVGADGAVVAVAGGEYQQFVDAALTAVAVDMVEFRPRYGEVQFAAAEVAVEVDVVEVALARFGEGEVQAVRVAAGNGAGRVGEGAPEEAGGAEGEDGGDEAEGEGGVAAAVHPEVGQVLREDTGGEEQPPAEPVGAGDGARGAVPRAQRDVRARCGRGGGQRFAVGGLGLPMVLSRPPGDSDRDERCEGGKSCGNAARQWPVHQHDSGGKEEEAVGEDEPGERAASRRWQWGVIRQRVAVAHGTAGGDDGVEAGVVVARRAQGAVVAVAVVAEDEDAVVVFDAAQVAPRQAQPGRAVADGDAVAVDAGDGAGGVGDEAAQGVPAGAQ